MLGRTVGELERSMSSAEFGEWLAFERAYGLPDIYFLVAAVCRTIAGVLGGKQMTGADFVPYFSAPPREQSPAEARAIVRAHLAAARARSGRV